MKGYVSNCIKTEVSTCKKGLNAKFQHLMDIKYQNFGFKTPIYKCERNFCTVHVCISYIVYTEYKKIYKNRHIQCMIECVILPSNLYSLY